MTHKKNKSKDLSLKSLETKLRLLPKAKASQTLKSRLFATIPNKPIGISYDFQLKRDFRIWNFSTTAAAAVLIVAFMFMVNYALSNPAPISMIEQNDTSLFSGSNQQYFFNDQNDFLAAMIFPNHSKGFVTLTNEHEN